jgi:SAM-dependent methyltransferase
MVRPSDVSPEIVARRAASFGGQAAAYAAERPDYSDAAVRWVLEPVRARTPLRVLDLAAGTGKLTQGLLRAGAEVIAVEPHEAVLAELRRLLPGVPAVAGSAESIPLGEHVLVMSDEERTELMDRVLAYLNATPETADGEFDLPLTTLTVRAVRA